MSGLKTKSLIYLEGSLIAGAFVTTNWGMSFTVPGMIIGGLGFLIFLFLVPNPEDVDLVPPVEQRSSQPQSAYEEDDPLMNGNGNSTFKVFFRGYKYIFRKCLIQ